MKLRVEIYEGDDRIKVTTIFNDQYGDSSYIMGLGERGKFGTELEVLESVKRHITKIQDKILGD